MSDVAVAADDARHWVIEGYWDSLTILDVCKVIWESRHRTSGGVSDTNQEKQ